MFFYLAFAIVTTIISTMFWSMFLLHFVYFFLFRIIVYGDELQNHIIADSAKAYRFDEEHGLLVEDVSLFIDLLKISRNPISSLSQLF